MMPLRIWKDRNFALVSIKYLYFHNDRFSHAPQINVVVFFGFMGFVTNAFWLSLYMQNVLRYSALEVAVHLLPQAICGIIINILAGLILHKVNNKLLTGIGALCYFLSSLLLALMKEDNAYWPFIFPSLLLSVIGADFQFNVANVSLLFTIPVPIRKNRN